jgi:hypothetical protein
MKFSVKYRAIQIDRKKILKSIHDKVSATFREAVREFYRAAFASVPVDTGMARGSLIPLGRVVRNVPTTISPKRSRPYAMKGYPDGKTLEAGIDRGQAAFKINISPGKYEFSYNIRVKHWIINERKLGWDALGRGRLAFKAKIKESRVASEVLKILRAGVKRK